MSHKVCIRRNNFPLALMAILIFGGISMFVPITVPAAFAQDTMSLTVSGPPYVTPGSDITYVLTVKNLTDQEITNIEAFSQLSANATWESGGTLIAKNGVEFTVPSLAANASQTLDLVINVGSDVKAGVFIEISETQIYQPEPVVKAAGVRTIVEALGKQVAVYKNARGTPFDVTVNGFSFVNYGNEPPRVSADDLSVDDLFLLFGEGVCQSGKTAADCVLSGPAQKWMGTQITEMGQGHCDGMATTSLLLFDQRPFKGKSTPGNYQPGATTASDLSFPLQSIENYIAYYFQTQSLWPAFKEEFKKSPVEIVNKLIMDFNKPMPVAYTLGVEQMPGHQKGHAIAAYAVETVNGTDESRILVYDNNFPKQRQYVTVDMAANTWRYVTASTPGNPPDEYKGKATGPTSGGLSILPTSARDLPAKKYFECSFCNDPTNSVRLQAAAAGMVAEGTITVQYAGEGAILVVNDEDQATGFAFDIEEYINEIPDAELIYARGGLGFDLPPRIKVPFVETDETLYSVFISGHTIDEVTQGSLIVSGPGFAIGVNDVELVPDEFLEFTLSPDGDHISFTATGTGEAPGIYISHDPIYDGDPSIIFDVEGVSLHAGETVYLDLDPELEQIYFQDTGSEDEQFDITMIMIWPDGDQEEYTEKIHVPAGSTNAFIDFGAWDGLLDPAIYIDDVIQNPSINHRLKLEGATGTYDPTPQANAPAGVYHVEATFSNVTEISLEDVYFTVVNLGAGDVVLNAVGGPASVGAEISVPADVLGPDGILHVNESFTFSFDVGLAIAGASELTVDANGVPYDWEHPDPEPAYDANYDSFVFEIDAGDLLATCGGYSVVVLDGDIVAPGFTGNIIVGTNGADMLIGSNRADLIVGLKGNDYIIGKGGSDLLCGHAGRDNIFGGNGADVIEGGDGRDRLAGQKGNDTIHGGKHNDVLLGGNGRDDLYGDEGHDLIAGGKGNDTLEGSAGRDVLFGNRGSDDLNGGNGYDTCIGGQGNDSSVDCEIYR